MEIKTVAFRYEQTPIHQMPLIDYQIVAIMIGLIAVFEDGIVMIAIGVGWIFFATNSHGRRTIYG